MVSRHPTLYVVVLVKIIFLNIYEYLWISRLRSNRVKLDTNDYFTALFDESSLDSNISSQIKNFSCSRNKYPLDLNPCSIL
jgi:hypothetical protein